jgi:2-polyprenyl-3-methyl-5-hydroxy-6-metoxy-1,4-benzoquinol methylase
MNGSGVPLHEQRQFWNAWNAAAREHAVGKVSLDQRAVILRWLTELQVQNARLVDLGCGTGWLCEKLTAFGTVTGADLADEVIDRARNRVPQVNFVAGDIMTLDLGDDSFDVVIALEVLAHVGDQAAFIRKVAHLLKPGGYAMIATQNRPVLERNKIPSPHPGQLRRWVDGAELRHLLQYHFKILELFSITPKYNRGPLRVLNSQRVASVATKFHLGTAMNTLKRIQENAGLGWTLMALAQKPPTKGNTLT